MIFQVTASTGGAYIQQVLRILEQWGFVDAFLPFLLIFALVYAILSKVNIFGPSQNDPDAAVKKVLGRRMNMLISFAISLMVVLPHILGRYPNPNTNPILIIHSLLPSGAVILVAILMLLLLLGMTGTALPNYISGVIGIAAIGILALIMLGTIFPAFQLGGLFADPALQALVIVLLVMGLVVWFVTREPAPTPAAGQPARGIRNSLSDWFGPLSGGGGQGGTV